MSSNPNMMSRGTLNNGNASDLRLIGVIVEKPTDKKYIGYVVMSERTGAKFAYTPEQMVTLLKNTKLVNAVFDKTATTNGGIVNTECSLDRLIKFNRGLQIIDTHNKLTLFYEICEGEKCLGYRVYSSNDKLINLTEQEILKMMNQTGCELVNGKRVNRDGKEFISGIKCEFRKIQHQSKAKKPTTKDPTEETGISKLSGRERENHEKFKVKLMNNCALAIRAMLIDNDGLPNTVVKAGGYYQPRKVAEIFANEIMKDIQMPDSDREKFEKIKAQIPKLTGKVDRSGKISKANVDMIRALFQFGLFVPEIDMRVKQLAGNGKLMYVKVRLGEKTSAEIMQEKGIACSKLREMIQMVGMLPYNKVMIDELNRKKQLTKYKMERAIKNVPVVNHTTFRTAEEIANLGYAISKNNDGYAYMNPRGGVYKLLFIGRNTGLSDADFNKYAGMAKCFGDIQTVTLIQSFMESLYDVRRYKYVTRDARDSEIISIVDNIMRNGLHRYIHSEYGDSASDKVEKFVAVQIAHIEILLALLAMHNKELYNVYLEDKKATGYKVFDGMVPKASSAHPLNEKLRLYYESGYSAYYASSHNGVGAFHYAGKYKGKVMQDMYSKNPNMVVNYFKMLPAGTPIKHADFKSLVDEIANLTSANCTREVIKEKVGILRVRKA